MHDHQHFCGQNTFRLGEFAKWPGNSPKLPWHVDLSGYGGSLTPAALIEAFRLAWSWWAEAADITPVFTQTAAEALIRKHFARIDGPSGILAWSELADNTNQPKTQRYDAGDNWIVTQGQMSGGIDLARVACHEIGHVLGLEHDGQNSGALMAPFISDAVPKPTARDIERLIGLGYKKRTTPIPPPPDPGELPPPYMIRLKKKLTAGDHGDFLLGSDVSIGDYLMLLGGDGPPPGVPDVPEVTRRRQLRLLASRARDEGQVDAANGIEKALADIPFLQIIIALLPFILSMLSGAPIDWIALLKVLSELFGRNGMTMG